MLGKIKKSLYFPVSYYFRFFAKIRLALWKPYIIVVTGSSGKTSLLHLLESQIGSEAKYSHHANSTYGIPFDILGLKRENLKSIEWIHLFFSTPFSILKPKPKEKIYIAEADCDRPGEGKYLASLLRPNATLWVGTGRTHVANFDREVVSGKFKTVEEAVAFEFGYFLEYCKDFSLVNGDSKLIDIQTKRSKALVEKISLKTLYSYEVFKNKTIFRTRKKSYELNMLLPKEIFYSLQMTLKLLVKLKIKPDLTFKNLTLPPGRNSVFKGIKGITIIDSTYNANLDSMSAVLNMFSQINHEKKWMILGDMLEQGESEKEEHEKLAEIISKMEFERLVLMGPRVLKYTYPKLRREKVSAFENPREVLNFLIANIEGGDLVLFKGARFLEGVIENLLEDKNDADKLARREEVWEARRRKFGL